MAPATLRCLHVVFLLGVQGLRTTATCTLNAQACPGSPIDWAHHASCTETRLFHNPCGNVQEEIELRIAENLDRKKLPGQYTLLSTQKGTCSKGSRATSPEAKPGPFTDLFGFLYETSGDGCLVTSCSESQVQSLCDFSTNFCNMFNLFCNELDGCQSLKHTLSYETALFGKNCYHTEMCGGWETNKTECTRR